MVKNIELKEKKYNEKVIKNTEICTDAYALYCHLENKSIVTI